MQIGTCAKLTNIDDLIHFIIGQYERYAAKQPERAVAPPLEENPPVAPSGKDWPSPYNDDIDSLIKQGAPIGQRSEFVLL